MAHRRRTFPRTANDSPPAIRTWQPRQIYLRVTLPTSNSEEAILSDPEKTLDEAVRAAEAETPQDETGVLEHALGVALQALRQPSIDAWLSPDDRAKLIWGDLVTVVDKIRGIMASG